MEQKKWDRIFAFALEHKHVIRGIINPYYDIHESHA